MRIAVTGVRGLLGWHAAARIHAQNCAARYRGDRAPYELVQIDRECFLDPNRLACALSETDVVLHFAGANRGEARDVERANPKIARQLIEACESAGASPHIVYANSIHKRNDNPYGRSKRAAGEILGGWAPRYTDLVLPHIFGECAKPYYNNVTATLIDTLWRNQTPSINGNGAVELLHAGEAAQAAIDAGLRGDVEEIVPKGRMLAIPELYERLKYFHDLYQSNIFPDLSDAFDLSLFNSYRTGGFPDHYPMPLKINEDHRGVLFESAKGGGASQTFLSTTHPGKTRGDHFHTDLVERFLVVKGEAVIRVRKVLTDQVHSFRVSGTKPAVIDQIPLHTHHIENVGDDEAITFFWAHRMFDPAHPDTFADPVMNEVAA